MKTFRIILHAFVTPGVLLLCSACSDCPTPPGVKPHAVDSTSHDWAFTMYEVGAMNTSLYDVCALSPDYAVAVGHLDSDTAALPIPYPNAYLWNGTNLIRISLPIFPHDTVTIDPQKKPNTSFGFAWLNAIWAFRRDNLWYSTEYGSIAHMTIRGLDTMVHQETWETKLGYPPTPCRKVWAKDTNELYFGGDAGSVIKIKDGNWTRIPASTNPDAGKVQDIYGTTDHNILVSVVGVRNHFFSRFNGSNWVTVWKYGDPSLSPGVNFGAPLCFWGYYGEDSVWISGLWLGRMKSNTSDKITPIIDVRQDGVLKIHGQKQNNVFFCGYKGLIMHWNGATFRRYDDFNTMGITFESVKTLENDVFIVGERYFGGGIFVHGRRIK